MSVKYCPPVPVFHFWPKLTHPAARYLCHGWASCWKLLLKFCFVVYYAYFSRASFLQDFTFLKIIVTTRGDVKLYFENSTFWRHHSLIGPGQYFACDHRVGSETWWVGSDRLAANRIAVDISDVTTNESFRLSTWLCGCVTSNWKGLLQRSSRLTSETASAQNHNKWSKQTYCSFSILRE